MEVLVHAAAQAAIQSHLSRKGSELFMQGAQLVMHSCKDAGTQWLDVCPLEEGPVTCCAAFHPGVCCTQVRDSCADASSVSHE